VDLLAALGGCSTEKRAADAGDASSSSARESPAPDTTRAEEGGRGVGAVRYVDLEGGFYGLVADDGSRYDPQSLPDSLRVDGRRVRFRIRMRDALTTRMWGTPVTVLHVETAAGGPR
jgi:hypothetical protein